MRVLITGGAGFIGSHLVEAMVARGDDVSVLDSFDDFYSPAWKERNLSRVRDRIRVHRGDIRDPEAVARAVTGADCVVHLAARAGVRPSIAEPIEYIRVNVEGTQVLLDALTRAETPHMVLASSSSVYGVRSRGPFAEDDPLGVPASPYASSKLAAELICRTWQHLQGRQLTVLRFFTVYGPRQRPDMAIHRFTSAIMRGEPIQVYGDGSSLRDYTYVGDVVRGVMAAVDRPLDSSVINLGNSSPVELQSLIEAIGRAVGRTPIIEHVEQQPGDVPMTWADHTRAGQLLGFHPSTPLDGGLRRFVTWLRRHEREQAS